MEEEVSSPAIHHVELLAHNDEGLVDHDHASDDHRSPQEESVKETHPPHVALWIFYVLGLATLLGWNAMLSSVDYLMLFYTGDPLLFLTAVFEIPNLLVTLLLAFYGERINFKVRFVGGFSFYIVYFVTAPIVIESMPAAASWPLLLVMTFMLGTANAVTEASLYGYANVFGSDAVQKGHAGQALSGLLISALRVLTKASFPNDASGTRGSAYLFFALACVPCLLLVLLFYTVPVLRNESRRRDSRVDWSKVRDAWRGVKQLTLTVAANYLLTLLIFPGLVVTQPSFSDALDPGWFAVLLILAYNVCDYAFREVALLPKLRMHAKRAIFVFVASRIVFLPLFIMGVHGLVHSPAYAILLTCLLGATNGWASVNAFMKAQEDVEKRLAEAAGYIMINGLIVGITAGVVLAIPLHYAILKDS